MIKGNLKLILALSLVAVGSILTYSLTNRTGDISKATISSVATNDPAFVNVTDSNSTPSKETRITTASQEALDKTDSIDVLTKSKNFNELAGECTEYTENPKIDRKKAIEIANSQGGPLEKARKVTAVKVRFTAKNTPNSPNLKHDLNDYPVWIVTFRGTEERRLGGSGDIVIADRNIVIDCETGDVIETFSYGHEE